LFYKNQAFFEIFKVKFLGHFMPVIRPYPSYCQTNLPWLGQIPAHWDVKRLKFVAVINPSKKEINHLPKELEVSFLPMELVGEGSLNTEKTKSLEDVGQGFTYFRDGDIIVAKITPSFENGKVLVITHKSVFRHFRCLLP
jgi:type I restriction enzyme S subunit